MGTPYNPQDGSYFVHRLSNSITDYGDRMTQTTDSLTGGKRIKRVNSKKEKKRKKKFLQTRIKSRRFQNKRFRYTNGRSFVYQKHKSHRRKPE